LRLKSARKEGSPRTREIRLSGYHRKVQRQETRAQLSSAGQRMSRLLGDGRESRVDSSSGGEKLECLERPDFLVNCGKWGAKLELAVGRQVRLTQRIRKTPKSWKILDADFAGNVSPEVCF